MSSTSSEAPSAAFVECESDPRADLLAPFFDAEALTALERPLARIARDLVAGLPSAGFDAVDDLGAPYAVRAQSAWLGWRRDLEGELLAWIADHRAAARADDAVAYVRVGARFDRIIRSLIAERRDVRACDVTSLLMSVRWDDGRRIDEDEVAWVLRAWTGGDLTALALCTGVVLRWLASDTALQARLTTATDAGVEAAIEEALRLDDPFTTSGRPAGRGRTRSLATRELRVLVRAVLAAGVLHVSADEDVARGALRRVPLRISPRG